MKQTPKESVIEENQAEADRRLEALKTNEAATGRRSDGYFTGLHEDRSELAVRTSTDEISMRDYQGIESEVRLAEKIERVNRELEAER